MSQEASARADEPTIPIRVLLVEDDPDDAELMLRELRQAGFEPEATRVDTVSAYLAGLETPPDIILADYHLPRFDCLRALELVAERGLNVPFIVVSGRIGEDVAVEAMTKGAADYLLKDRLGRLGQAVAMALQRRRLQEDANRAHRALESALEQERTSRALLDAVLASSPIGLAFLDRDLRVVRINQAMAQLHGVPLAAHLGRRLAEVAPRVADEVEANCRTVLEGGEPVVDLEGRGYSRGGPRGQRRFYVSYFPVEAEGSRRIGVGIALVETTELAAAEADLRRSLDDLQRSTSKGGALLEQMAFTLEQERGRVAGEIQAAGVRSIAAIASRLDRLREWVQGSDAERALADLEEAVDDATEKMRSLMAEFRSSTPEAEGLLATLRAHLEHLSEETGIAFRLEGHLESEPAAGGRRMLYRIAREALANVRMHARASVVEVAAETRAGGVYLRVRDDGRGFRRDREADEGVAPPSGLATMRDCAEIGGGWWMLTTSPGEGTTVEAWLPQTQTVPLPDLEETLGL